MDRAAKLAADARDFLMFERHYADRYTAEQARGITRAALAGRAEEYGFAPNEISAAVDQALTDAGTTP